MRTCFVLLYFIYLFIHLLGDTGDWTQGLVLGGICFRISTDKVKETIIKKKIRSGRSRQSWRQIENDMLRINSVSQALWLMPVIPATQEADIRRIAVQSQPRQIVHKTLSQKKPLA
jgi:hypothetical protein